ncbi:hypothetical protein SD457_15320 [Coprobacillaceae bacterium CR2/5/TPMF4]|nr:hypothetical protein SD457_15320 [Coprobacillaceae bacterium CR2/5/TPMF4]
MGNFKFAMKMLVKEYKNSLFYCLTLVFAIAVCFIFFNIINNDLLKDPGAVSGGVSWQQVKVPFSTSLSFMIICFCCFMIFLLIISLFQEKLMKLQLCPFLVIVQSHQHYI